MFLNKMAPNMEASTIPKIPAEINTATRSLHTHLNALITSRLPLVLPPHADTPLVYTTGLIPFARVFIAFEHAWDKACTQKMLLELRQNSSASGSVWGEDVWVDVPLELLAQSHDLGASIEGQESQTTSENGQAASSTLSSVSSLPPLPDSPLTRSTVSHHQAIRLLRALRNLRPPGITRSTRLRNDLAALLDISVEEVDELLSQTTNQDHELYSPATDAFIAHMEEITAEKPQVLIAYAFVLYMAIFSGGRWIRSVLSSAGSSFWKRERANGQEDNDEEEELASTSSRSNTILLAPTPATQVRLEKLGLSFWFFQSPTDGLDIKAEFKNRLDALEPLLTDEQREDVVEEAREIFERCESLVSDLDERVGRQGRLVKVARAGEEDAASDSPTAADLESKAFGQNPEAAARLRLMLRGWQEVSAYAGWALVVGCVGWYAMQVMEA